MDILQILLLAAALFFVILWLSGQRKKKASLPGHTQLKQILSKRNELKQIPKKEDDPSHDIQQKPSKRLNEDWLRKQLLDLDAYLDNPSEVEKFFIGLRHTYINPRDAKVIESYEQKFKAATKMMLSVIEYLQTGNRGAHLNEEVELTNLNTKATILGKKIEIFRKEKEFKKLQEMDIERPQEDFISPEIEILESIRRELNILKSQETAVFEILERKEQSLAMIDPHKSPLLYRKIANLYDNLIMEVMEARKK